MITQYCYAENVHGDRTKAGINVSFTRLSVPRNCICDRDARTRSCNKSLRVCGQKESQKL